MATRMSEGGMSGDTRRHTEAATVETENSTVSGGIEGNAESASRFDRTMAHAKEFMEATPEQHKK